MRSGIVALTVLLLLAGAGLVWAEIQIEQIDDALGQAYKAVTEKKMEEAKELFAKGAALAQQAQDWEGLIDAGYGFSTLGDPTEAKNLFDKAKPFVVTEQSWQGAVALGYAYASLPEKMNTLAAAEDIWTKAESWAQEENDTFGLIEAARGFASINKTALAERCLDAADPLVKAAPTAEAVKVLADAYRKLGKSDRAANCETYLKTAQPSPPPGWQPTAGETVREPKTVSVGVQQAQRASADQDIAAQVEYEKEQARLKQQEQLQRQQLAYQAYSDYLNYYSYPYYGVYSGVIHNSYDYYANSWCVRPVWAERTYPEIFNWASWYLGSYTWRDGHYYRKHHHDHHHRHDHHRRH